MKQCSVCLETKDLSEFHPNKQCKLGVVGTCRLCTRVRISSWYSDNRKDRQNDANRRNQIRKQKAVDKFGNKCNDCSQSFPNCVYQFHHTNPLEKDFNPSYGINHSEEKMWKELEKCVMLCANCHMIRHHFGKERINETTY